MDAEDPVRCPVRGGTEQLGYAETSSHALVFERPGIFYPFCGTVDVPDAGTGGADPGRAFPGDRDFSGFPGDFE